MIGWKSTFALACLPLLLAGCIGGDPVESATSPDGAGAMPPVVTTETVFEGVLVGMNPLYYPPAGAPLPMKIEGSEGFDHAFHPFPVPEGATNATLTLTWTSQNTPNGAFPDLDFEVFDPSGALVGGTDGATGAQTETITLPGPLAPGEYSARVANYLGAQVSYQLTVAVTAPEAATPAAA